MLFFLVTLSIPYVYQSASSGETEPGCISYLFKKLAIVIFPSLKSVGQPHSLEIQLETLEAEFIFLPETSIFAFKSFN